jgi:hypothetical protein
MALPFCIVKNIITPPTNCRGILSGTVGPLAYGFSKTKNLNASSNFNSFVFPFFVLLKSSLFKINVFFKYSVCFSLNESTTEILYKNLVASIFIILAIREISVEEDTQPSQVKGNGITILNRRLHSYLDLYAAIFFECILKMPIIKKQETLFF